MQEILDTLRTLKIVLQNNRLIPYQPITPTTRQWLTQNKSQIKLALRHEDHNTIVEVIEGALKSEIVSEEFWPLPIEKSEVDHYLKIVIKASKAGIGPPEERWRHATQELNTGAAKDTNCRVQAILRQAKDRLAAMTSAQVDQYFGGN